MLNLSMEKVVKYGAIKIYKHYKYNLCNFRRKFFHVNVDIKLENSCK